MIQLKPLKSDYMADVLRIQDYCYTEIEPESSESLRAKILASPNTCLIAESSEGMLGYLIAAPILYPHLPALNAPTFEVSASADTIYIHDLAVASAGRGKGIAKAAQGAHRLHVERSVDLEKYPPRGRLNQYPPQSPTRCVADPYASGSRHDRKGGLNRDIRLRPAGAQIRHHFENTLDRAI